MPPRSSLALLPGPSPSLEFKKGDWIFKQGDAASSFFIILQGQVLLTVTLDSATGDAMDLPILSEGDTLGDLAVITEKSRSASARALSRVRVLEVTTEEFNQAILAWPPWGPKLVKGLAGKLASLHARLSQDTISKLATAIETVRMAKELQIAQAVQDTLFPSSHQDFGRFEISGYFEPASECSGDWWYHSRVGDKLLIWIGDATGHGVAAALVMSAVRAVASVLEKSPSISPSLVLSTLNQTLCELTNCDQMMTFFMASYDPATLLLTYANASHEPVMVFRRAVESENGPIPKKLYLDGPRGARLGEDPNSHYEEAQLRLQPGDLLFAYTDGLPDLRNAKGKSWGELKMFRAIEKSLLQTVSASKLIRDLKNEILTFAGKSRRQDDITFLAFHLRDETKGVSQEARNSSGASLPPEGLDPGSRNQILGFDARMIPFLPVGILKNHPKVLLIHSDWFKEHLQDIPRQFLSQAILVGSNLSDLECISYAIQSSVCHIVQSSEARLQEDTIQTLKMIERPELFLRDPISHLFQTPPLKLFKQNLTSPSEKKAALNGMRQFLSSHSGLHSSLLDTALQQADELMMNAIYSAPVSSDGKALFQEMDRREMAEISSPVKATLYAAIHESKLLVACQDGFGSLNLQHLLQRIRTCLQAGPAEAMNLSSQGGAGIGSYLVYASSKTYCLFLSRGKMTFIGSIIPLGISMKKLSTIPKTIHIISEDEGSNQ